MFNFFADIYCKIDDQYLIKGTDYNHIKNVLRMRVGESILVSCEGKSDLCKIIAFEKDSAVAEIIEENYQCTELPVEITLFQGLPKSDKMELIIQKTVELGISRIIPVEMKHCVVKLDDKKKNSKVTRWQAIAESAAKQSKRNIIPEIGNVLTYKEMLSSAKEMDLFLVPYEAKDGMNAIAKSLSEIRKGMKIGILIGPEGGFDESEIELASEHGGRVISLGKRILRTETAAIASVSAVMLYTEINLGGDV